MNPFDELVSEAAMSRLGEHVVVVTRGGRVVTGRIFDYHNLHLCIASGKQAKWIALDRIKTIETTGAPPLGVSE